jgi:hypothetical protein
VNSFRDRGWVHGNVRDVRYLSLCDREKLMPIDFNLGGKDGEVRYPKVLIPK